jgi:hypothetical protein
MKKRSLLPCLLLTPALAFAQPADVPWDAVGGGVNGPVIAVVAAGGDSLYVVGAFTQAGGVAANNVALWNGSAFEALGTGLSGTITSAAVIGSDLYVGGSAMQGNYNDHAHWNGTQWIYGNAFSGNFPQIFTLFSHGDTLYAGGITSGFGGSDDHVMRLVNGVWESLGSTLNNLVHALGWHDGQLVAGGDFTALQNGGGTNLNHVAVLTGGDWGPLGDGLPDPVNALLDMDGTVYAGGAIRSGGTLQFGLASLGAEATEWELLMPGAAGYVNSGTLQNAAIQALGSDGAYLYAGGDFNLDMGSTTGSHVARYDQAPDAFTPFAVLNAPVASLAHNATLGLIAGGSFTENNGADLPYLGHTDQATAIHDVDEAPALQAFPNPTSEQITVTLNHAQGRTAKLEILSMDGRTLIGPIRLNGPLALVDLSGLANGLYLVRVVDGLEPISQFVVKQ